MRKQIAFFCRNRLHPPAQIIAHVEIEQVRIRKGLDAVDEPHDDQTGVGKLPRFVVAVAFGFEKSGVV